MATRRASSTEFTQADAIELVQTLNRFQINFWIDGGWGVDALVERQTRIHGDIDIVLRKSDTPAMIRASASLGYAREEDGRPFNFFMIDARGRQIDVHSVVFDELGDGLYGPQPDDGTGLRYPAAAFLGAGKIGGIPVQCLTAEYQVANHSGYELEQRDLHDLRLLRDSFGLSSSG